jgi:type VI secretion system protein ImpH
MASSARQTPDSIALENALRDHPEAFEFFDAARRLECAFPHRPRIGNSTKATDDFVRLCHSPSLAFAPRMIDKYELGKDGKPPKLKGFFLGLFGPHGPLPLHLTEYAMDRERFHQDRTFAAFADMFHHRMMGLFYRAWADAQPTVQYDRPGEDRFALYVGALVGLSTGNLTGRDALPDQYKRFFAGRLLSQARSSEGLIGLLERFFRVPVSLIEHVAEWMHLPAVSSLRLGGSPDTATLGQTAVIGEWVWGAQQRFRLRIGPLNRADFNKFLPGGESLKQLVAAVKTYVGEEMAWDVQLVLQKSEVPSTSLGKAGRLGLNSWMTKGNPPIDADQVVLRPVG